MPVTGVWRGDSPPIQRAPTAPIPAQGQQPPLARTQIATAMAIAAMAWWPNTGEPRPIQPRQIRLPTAPIPAQGQQPPTVGPIPLATAGVIGAQWPAPTSSSPQALGVAPLIPVVIASAQPYPSNGLQAVASWPAPWWCKTPSVGIAPLTLTYGQAPPSIGSVVPLATLTSWQPYPPQPPRIPSFTPIAPIIATAQPFALVPFAVLSAWDSPWWSAPRGAGVASWAGTVVVPAAQPYPPSQAGISAWPPLWYGPPKPTVVAPLTLVYGQQPSVGSARQAQERTAVVRPQWPAPWTEPQRLITVAPLTLKYGQAPPVVGVLTAGVLRAIVTQSPAVWWPASWAAPVAAWTRSVIPPAPVIVVPPPEPKRFLFNRGGVRMIRRKG